MITPEQRISDNDELAHDGNDFDLGGLFRPDEVLFDKLRAAELPIGDHGYDSNRFCDALREHGIKPCTSSTKNRKQAIDKALHKQRHTIENIFVKLKDGRQTAMCYDRCAHTFFSAICIAATVPFYL